MAELTSGAVSSLLGLIRNEAALPRGVQGDVEFIKEEMESMNGFLEYLARRGDDNGEQVRAWMKQVRDLTYICTDCIELYVRDANPDNQLGKRDLRRCLLWAPWFLKKMVARHRLAAQLREIRLKLRDVGERRLRYGINVPVPQSPAVPSEAATTSTVDDDYLSKRLVEWVSRARHPPITTDPMPPSILFVLPDTGNDDGDAFALAHRALAMAQAHFNRRSILVDVPAVHWDPLPLRRKEILYYILRKIRLTSQSQQGSQQDLAGNGEEEIRPISQSQGPQQEDPGNDDSWFTTKWGIYHLKKSLLGNIKQNIKEMQVDEKLAEVKDSMIHRVESDQPLMMLSLLKTKK